MKEKTLNYLNHRRQKSQDALRDAETLFKNDGTLPAVVNRIYYALFYEIEALLLTRELSSSKHGGVRSLFNFHFVKSGVVSTEISSFYGSLFDNRQKSDYGEYMTFEQDHVRTWLSKSKSYISELDQLIDKELNNPDDAGEKS